MNKKILYLYKYFFSNKPLNVVMVLSLRCNLRCKQCSIWKHQIDDILTLKQRFQIINKLSLWLGKFQLNLAGGESLTHPNLFKITDYIVKKNINFTINTNGTLLNKNRMDRLAKYKNNIHLHFSLDSTSKKKHDYLRGRKDTFDKVVNSIKYWHFVKKMPFNITSVISAKNSGELTDLCDFAIELGAKNINFQPLNLYSFINKRKSVSEFKKHVLWPKEYRKLKIDIKKLIKYKTSKKGYIINNSLDELHKYLIYFKNPFGNTLKCTDNTRAITINRNGDVSLCASQDFIFGNILNDDIESIFNSKKRIQLNKQKALCTLPCKSLTCYRNKNYEFILNTISNKVAKKLSQTTNN